MGGLGFDDEDETRYLTLLQSVWIIGCARGIWICIYSRLHAYLSYVSISISLYGVIVGVIHALYGQLGSPRSSFKVQVTMIRAGNYQDAIFHQQESRQRIDEAYF